MTTINIKKKANPIDEFCPGTVTEKPLKQNKKNIANISSCSDEEIEAIEFALKNKDNPEFLQQIAQTKTAYWKKAGACIALYQIIKQLELDKVLGKDEEGQYALW